MSKIYSTYPFPYRPLRHFIGLAQFWSGPLCIPKMRSQASQNKEVLKYHFHVNTYETPCILFQISLLLFLPWREYSTASQLSKNLRKVPLILQNLKMNFVFYETHLQQTDCWQKSKQIPLRIKSHWIRNKLHVLVHNIVFLPILHVRCKNLDQRPNITHDW